MTRFYDFLLILILFFAQVYRQCLFIDMRKVLRENQVDFKHMWFVERLSRYIDLKKDIKIEKERLYKLEELNNEKDSSGSKKKRKQKSGGICKGLWRNIDEYIPTLVMWEARLLIGI